MNKDRMNEASRHYIACSLNEQKSIAEIARDMGMTQVQVSRMESRILKRMRGMAGE